MMQNAPPELGGASLSEVTKPNELRGSAPAPGAIPGHAA